MGKLVQPQNIIDVTKAPYFADNTGKKDCTKSLCAVFDDVLRREVEGILETKNKLLASPTPTYIGFESRITPGYLGVIFPETVPASRIIYFPAGTYLVSDTVGYTLKNLQNIYHAKPFSELCRGIHIEGESRETVTIKLCDNSPGFERGAHKAVISFLSEESLKKPGEISNVAQLNTIRDLTIDCGKGNEGAIGLTFIANNSGRVRKMTIKAHGSYCGLKLPYGTEGCFSELNISGFQHGVELHNSSVCVFTDCKLNENSESACLTGNSLAIWKNIQAAPLPLLRFDPTLGEMQGGCYVYAGCDSDAESITFGNCVITRAEESYCKLTIPHDFVHEEGSVCCVDDFGAVGDGVTDCTVAIQKALDSGKPMVCFSDGHYLVDGTLHVPAEVQCIDFNFCDLFSGEKLRKGERPAFIAVDADSKELLQIRNLYSFEQFFGHFHFIEHAAKRDILLSDLHIQTAAMYRNTVSGSKVYLDNCACTTGTYCHDLILSRDGMEPEYCYRIPFEFHGQTVYGRQVNPERADVEMLNDASNIVLDGLKVEGPGTALRTVNGGYSEVNIFSAGIGMRDGKEALFETENSSLNFYLGKVFGFDAESCYHTVFRSADGKKREEILFDDYSRITPFGCRPEIYHFYCKESLF